MDKEQFHERNKSKYFIIARWNCFWHIIHHMLAFDEFNSHQEYSVTTDIYLWKIKIWVRVDKIGCICGDVFYDKL